MSIALVPPESRTGSHGALPPDASRRRAPGTIGTVAAAVLRACVAVLLAGFLIAVPITPAPHAEAAVIGRMLAFGGWQVGAFISSTGDYVYCLEPGSSEPSGQQYAGEAVDTLPAYASTFPDLTGWSSRVTSSTVSGERVRQINYVLWHHGRTTDAGTAVVVQFAIWMLRDDPGARAWLDHHLAWVRNNGGGAYVDAAVTMAAEARARATAVPRPDPGQLRIALDPAGRGEHGAYGGVVHYPAGTTGLRISGAVFANGTDRLDISGGVAGSAAWRATPHTSEWAQKHEVSVSGTWRLERAEWPARVRLFSPVIAGQQRLGAGIAQATVAFTGSFATSDTSETRFSPVLSTQVPERFLSVGERFADTVTLSEAEGSEPWPSRRTADGSTEFVPIAADGIVYGPFEAPQSESSEAPAGAPVAGRAELTADAGPGEYRVEGDREVELPGYYYWVWRIRESEQSPEIRRSGLLSPDYEFADDFGLVAEGHVVPAALRWSTELAEQEIDADRLVLRDRITAEAENGIWLRDAAGVPVPVRIRLTVFGSETEPERAEQPPGSAIELVRGFVDIPEPGATVEAEAIELPEDTRGWVTVQACLLLEDQPDEWRGYAEEWCDDYGVPAETARIVVPEPPAPETPKPETPKPVTEVPPAEAPVPDAPVSEPVEVEPKTPEPVKTLSVTGAAGGARPGALPLLAAGLLYSGAGTLLAGVLLRYSNRGKAGYLQRASSGRI